MLLPMVYYGSSRLIVEIIDAINVPASNPYLELSVEGQVCKTEGKEKSGGAPKWGKTFFFEAKEGSKFNINLFETKKKSSKPIASGFFTVKLTPLNEHVLEVVSLSSEKEKNCKLQLKFAFQQAANIPQSQILFYDLFMTNANIGGGWSPLFLPSEQWRDVSFLFPFFPLFPFSFFLNFLFFFLFLFAPITQTN